ncbi:partial Small-conductance mechanosensitive channel, partial [uncultured bacterium]
LEYLIPNSNLVSNTIVNYSLSSPLVWIALPVGVAYSSDPQQVKRILLEVAAREPMVYPHEKPIVIFGELAESSLNFDLVVCIDVRAYAERAVKSSLYFAIFEEFKKTGIEIPFPQRDVHVRTPGGVLPEASQA